MKAESRAEYIHAARQVFAEKGYHGTSVDDIATRANRSKGGFYYHFQAKDQLVSELFNDILNGINFQIQSHLKSGEPLKKILLQLIDDCSPIMRDRKQMLIGADFFFVAL